MIGCSGVAAWEETQKARRELSLPALLALRWLLLLELIRFPVARSSSKAVPEELTALITFPIYMCTIGWFGQLFAPVLEEQGFSPLVAPPTRASSVKAILSSLLYFYAFDLTNVARG